MEGRERGVVPEAKQRQSEIEDPTPRENTSNTVRPDWSAEFRCGRRSGVAEVCCLLRVEESARLDFG